jgi:[histone H3]-lysine4 N-trimethyltransferase ASH1L
VSPTLSIGGGGATSSSPAPSTSRTSLSAQIAALRVPRNIRTRGLASVAQDPEVEKTAKMAVVLREICAEIGSKKSK